MITSVLKAQNFVGELIYKTNRKIDLSSSSKKMLPKGKKHFSSLLNAFKKTYVLEFDINQSIYYKKEKIGLNIEKSSSFTLIPNGNIG